MSSKYDTRTEKYQLPATVDGICALVREILNDGSVSRIELDTEDSYVRARRWVESGDFEEEDVGWDGALRNTDIVEYYSDGATSFQVVVDMMMLAQEDNLQATCWVVGRGEGDHIRAWFTIDERRLPVGKIGSVLGLPLYKLKSLPEETLILCCSKYLNADPNEISMAVKTTMELRRSHDNHGSSKQNGKADGGVGDHPPQYPPAAGQLALGTGGLRTVSWHPPGKAR